MIKNFENLTKNFDFLPNILSFGKCQKCTGIFGPKFLVLTVKFRENTLEFENLNGTQCLTRLLPNDPSKRESECSKQITTAYLCK